MMSKALAHAAAMEAIRFALAEVTQRVIYVDTIFVLIRRWLPPREWEELSRANASPIGEQGSVFPSDTPAHNFVSRIVIQQPTIEAMAYLADVAPGHIVNGFDLALDLIMRSKDAVRALELLLLMQITQKHRGSRSTNAVEDTTYLGPRSATRNTAIYADKVSKVTGEPAVHIEVKSNGAGTCRNYGLVHTSQFRSMDPSSVIKRHDRLSSLDWDQLEPEMHAILDRSKMGASAYRGRVFGNLVRLHGGRVGTLGDLRSVPVQGMLDFARDNIAYKFAINSAATHSEVDQLLEGATMHYRRRSRVLE